MVFTWLEEVVVLDGPNPVYKRKVKAGRVLFVLAASLNNPWTGEFNKSSTIAFLSA
jgi:hypothetical protein